jgi:hypothetical protein
LLGGAGKSDIIVTPEKAAELSRPKLDASADAKSKIVRPAKGVATTSTSPIGAAIPAVSPSTLPALTDGGRTDANGVDMTLRDAAAAIGHESSGIGGAAYLSQTGPVGEDQGKTFEEVGPNGTIRKVRVVGN